MSVSQTARPHSGGATPEDIVARIERLPLSSWQIRTRIIVGTATFFDAFDALSIAYVLPVIVPLWKLAPGQIGTLISFGFLGQLIGALIGGSLAERFGRRPVIVVAVLWFGLLSLACGFAWSYESLLVLRLLQGLGLGAEVPVAATYISELAKAGGRGRFVLLFELVFPLGLLASGGAGALDRSHSRLAIPVLRRRGAGAVCAVHDAQPAGIAALARLARPLGATPRDAIAFIEKQVVAATGKPLPPVGAGFAARRHQAPVVVGPVRRRLSQPYPGDLGVLVRHLFRQLRAHHLAADASTRTSSSCRSTQRADLRARRTDRGARHEPRLRAPHRHRRASDLVRGGVRRRGGRISDAVVDRADHAPNACW